MCVERDRDGGRVKGGFTLSLFQEEKETTERGRDGERKKRREGRAAIQLVWKGDGGV